MTISDPILTSKVHDHDQNLPAHDRCRDLFTEVSRDVGTDVSRDVRTDRSRSAKEVVTMHDAQSIQAVGIFRKHNNDAVSGITMS